MLADSDAPAQFSDTDAGDLRGKGVNVTKWDGGLSLEERVFADLAWSGILGSFDLACTVRGDRDKVIDQIGSQYGAGFNRDPAAWTDSGGLRTALGRAAKAGEGWFKRQDRAQEWAAIICSHLDDAALENSDLVRKLTELREWIDRA